MKILNLYAGIGGNRKLWGDEHQVTAVENKEDIAEVYQRLFPKDKVVIGDAHQYLIDHHQEFDFIWSSPPCPTHSVTNHFLKGQGIFRYPDMKLWQEIIFLKHFFKGKYVIENVKSYYKPIYEPQVIGKTFSLPAKKLSKPIKGNTGVFVVIVNSITPGVLPTDLAETQKQYAQTMAGRVENSVYTALIKKGNVEDKRYRFF